MPNIIPEGATFCPEQIQVGRLAPWEVAKAIAYRDVVKHILEHTGMSAHDLLGVRVDDFIAKRITLKGGGHPSPRAIRALLSKCSDPSWYPGKARDNVGGRPATISNFQRREVARAAMGLKRKRIAPSPARVRAALPRRSLNPETGAPLSDKTIREVFKTLCYDEDCSGNHESVFEV